MIKKRKFAAKYYKNKLKLQKNSKPNGDYAPLSLLPYPRIHQILKTSQALDELPGSFKGILKKIICDKSNNCADLPIEIYNAGKRGREFLRNIIKIIDGKDVPLEKIQTNDKMTIFDTLYYYRYTLNNGKLFEISNELSGALIKTDIKGKCPVSYMKPPFPSIYIHFGVTGQYLLPCHDGIFEGAFINYGELNNPFDDKFINKTQEDLIESGFNVEHIKSFLEIKLVFTHSTNKKHFLSTSRMIETLYIDNEDDTVEQILEKNLKYISLGRKEGNKEFDENFSSCIIHLAKSLLYINTRNKNDLIEVSPIDNNQANNVDINIKDKKIASLIKSFTKYNKIIINNKDNDIQEDLSNSEKMNKSGIKPHWRRGHFRALPPLPPNRPEERLTWIKPTLVGSCKPKDAKESSYIATV